MRHYVTLTPLLFALFLGGHSKPLEATTQKPALQNIVASYRPQPIKPLADLLARGEGDWDSVNRGYAGDTPGGIQSLTGKAFADFTVGEVMWMQRSRIYAVGRYQFIPSTLRFAVEKAGVNANEKFTPEVQNKLLIALLFYKRPAIGGYIKGRHNNLDFALDELAREWASVAAWHGGSYYGGGGNRASITRREARLALIAARSYNQEAKQGEIND